MTIDHARLADEDRTPLPDFTPVPRRPRHDGWTPERQRGFIEALADTGSVRSAAHAVNMTPEGAYYLRRQPQAESFRAAWAAALRLGVQRLEDIAMERALYGVEVPVYHFGAVVGTRRVYNDRLLMFILRNRAGERFAADARNPEHDFSKLRQRLEKAWRAEWEREAAVRARDEDAAESAALVASLDAMHERHRRTMSPRTRALFSAAEAAHREDEAQDYYDDGPLPEEDEA